MNKEHNEIDDESIAPHLFEMIVCLVIIIFPLPFQSFPAIEDGKLFETTLAELEVLIWAFLVIQFMKLISPFTHGLFKVVAVLFKKIKEKR